MTSKTISLQDPAVILAGIKQFGLAPDGSDLQDLAAAIERLSMKLAVAKEFLEEMADLGNGPGCLFCGAGKYDRQEEHKPNCEVLEIRSFLIVLEKQEN